MRNKNEFMEEKLNIYFEILRFQNKQLNQQHLFGSVEIWEKEYENYNKISGKEASSQDKNTYIKTCINQYFDHLDYHNWDLKDGEIIEMITSWSKEFEEKTKVVSK